MNENVSEPNTDNVTHQIDIDKPACEEPVDVNMLGKETLPNQDVTIEADKGIVEPIKVDQPISKPPHPENNESEVKNIDIADNDGLHLKGDESSGDEQVALTDEVDFNVSSLVYALASNAIIQKLCWLLKHYKTNSIATNHYIITMLRRICDDLELSPMLYQLSLLTIFYDILEEQKLRPCKEHENIVTFLTTLVRRMLRKMKDYPLLFVEVLFWKTRKECHYINCGSMLNELTGIRNGIREGTSRDKNEDNGFVEGQKWVRRNIGDALGDDDFETFCQDIQQEGHPEEKVDGSPESGNDIIFTDEMNAKLKDLYQKHKDNPDCCQLIAGELVSSGEISNTQISKTLKRLGLKVPAKTKKKSSKENSSTRKPTHSRKRVNAFNEDQEQKIKELFEQFKDQRRCSYLIANALDGTGGISAAQVSRKLKQLGLVRPKNKKSNSNMNLRDEGAGESDDEPLLSMRNRGKQKRNRSQYDERESKKVAQELPEDMSDDELPISVLAGKQKRNGRQYDERQSKKVAQELPEDMLDDELPISVLAGKQKRNGSQYDGRQSKKVAQELPKDMSDNELPISVLAKTRRISRTDEEIKTDSFDKGLGETDFTGRNTQVSEREEFAQSNQMGDVEVDHSSSDSEMEIIGVDDLKESDDKSFEKSDNSEHPLFDDVVDDELADFDENTVPVTTQENSTARRRLRMVLDFDDDDE